MSDEPTIVEFSQDEIDLMIYALEMWQARIAWENADGRRPDLGCRWGATFVNSRAASLVKKLKAW